MNNLRPLPLISYLDDFEPLNNRKFHPNKEVYHTTKRII